MGKDMYQKILVSLSDEAKGTMKKLKEGNARLNQTTVMRTLLNLIKDVDLKSVIIAVDKNGVTILKDFNKVISTKDGTVDSVNITIESDDNGARLDGICIPSKESIGITK